MYKHIYIYINVPLRIAWDAACTHSRHGLMLSVQLCNRISVCSRFLSSLLETNMLCLTDRIECKASATMKRMHSFRDHDALKVLVRMHIDEAPSKSLTKWTNVGHDDVCDAFEGFMMAVARTGHLLDKTTFNRVLREMYECERRILQSFAEAVRQALAHARRCSHTMRNGTRTEGGLLKIVQAYWDFSKQKRQSTRASSQCISDDDSTEDGCEDSAEDDDDDGDDAADDGDNHNATLEELKAEFPESAPEAVPALFPRSLHRHVSIASSCSPPKSDSPLPTWGDLFSPPAEDKVGTPINASPRQNI